MVSTATRFEDEESGTMITDINVTPLVDITLVLLIIFMVTTTYIVNPTIKVELPKAATGSEQARTTLSLTLTKEGVLYLNGERSDDAGVRFAQESRSAGHHRGRQDRSPRQRGAPHRPGETRGRAQIRHQRGHRFARGLGPRALGGPGWSRAWLLLDGRPMQPYGARWPR
jgi:hypothetical protein